MTLYSDEWSLLDFSIDTSPWCNKMRLIDCFRLVHNKVFEINTLCGENSQAGGRDRRSPRQQNQRHATQLFSFSTSRRYRRRWIGASLRRHSHHRLFQPNRKVRSGFVNDSQYEREEFVPQSPVCLCGSSHRNKFFLKLPRWLRRDRVARDDPWFCAENTLHANIQQNFQKPLLSLKHSFFL